MSLRVSWCGDYPRGLEVGVDDETDKGVVLADFVLLDVDPSGHLLVKALLIGFGGVRLGLFVLCFQCVLQVVSKLHDHVDPILAGVHDEDKYVSHILGVIAEGEAAPDNSILVQMSLVRGLLDSASVVLLGGLHGARVQDFREDFDLGNLLDVLFVHEKI